MGCGCGRGSHLLVSGPSSARLNSGLRVSNYVSRGPQSVVSAFEKYFGPHESAGIGKLLNLFLGCEVGCGHGFV